MDISNEESCRDLMDKASKIFENIDSIVVMVGGYIEDDVNTLSGLDEMINNHLKIPLYLSKYITCFQY